MKEQSGLKNSREVYRKMSLFCPLVLLLTVHTSCTEAGLVDDEEDGVSERDDSVGRALPSPTPLPYTEPFASLGGSFKCSNKSCAWTSPQINISGVSKLDLSAAVQCLDVGNFETSDYIKISYQLDGGSWSSLLSRTGDFSPMTAQKTLTSASKILQIKIEAKTSASNETYVVKNLAVKKASSTDPTVKSTCYDPIVKKPSSVGTKWSDIHTFTRYLKISKYNMHVVGTASVSDWMMRESCLFYEAMVSSIKDSANRAKMSGFVAHITTFEDEPINSHNQRSGGTYLANLTCEEMVCGVSPKDPYDPTREQRYRNWVVPTHEMAHAIEITLGLQERTDQIYGANDSDYNSDTKREYLPWGAEKWFGTREGRDSMPAWERQYLSSVFNAQDDWRPRCTR